MRPKNAYGASKMVGEVYCRLGAQQRLENGGAASRARDRVTPLFATAASDGLLITVVRNQKILDFVWVDVGADALIQTAFGTYIRGQVNIGSGKGTTIVDLLRGLK